MYVKYLKNHQDTPKICSVYVLFDVLLFKE